MTSHSTVTAAFGSQAAAFDLASTADTITKTVVAVLTLIAAVLVVVGLGRAWRGRRKAQVVIEDVSPIGSLPTSSVSGLSPQLRQAVRRQLQQETRNASYSVLKTLDHDIKSGLLRTRGRIRVATVTNGLRSTTEDSLTTLAAGIRAVAPKEAEGLIAAMSAALPAQRGWTVCVTPVLRGTGSGTEVGMAIELSELGRPADDLTTFWTTAAEWTSAETDNRQTAVMELLLSRLLDPTALWIATRLVSRQLAQSGVPRRWRLVSRGKLVKELKGFQLQLAGQLSLYATRKQPEFARGFADQALDDLHGAADILREYFRPHMAEAAVHERLGWSYRHSEETLKAAKEFHLSIQSYDEAVRLVERSRGVIRDERAAAVERARVRRAKCRLLTGERGQLEVARGELAELCHMAGTGSLDLYNGACLFAIAMTCAEALAESKQGYEAYAWYLLGRALIAGGEGGPWEIALNDDELEAMDKQRRSSFSDELRTRHPSLAPLMDDRALSLVKDAMHAIGIALPTGIGESFGRQAASAGAGELSG